MTNWRPEGWENPYLTDVFDPKYESPMMYEHDAFEEGADAMLEALKNLPRQSFVSTTPVIKSGFYIFIPDNK